jgi:hypothetical protein
MTPAYLGGRHFFLMVLYILPFSGAGLAVTIRWLAARLPTLPWLPAVVLIAAASATIPSSVLRSPERGGILREGGAWIRNHSFGTPVVMTDAAKLSYHASAERVPFPDDYGQTVRLARAKGAQWIALYRDPTDEQAFSGLNKFVESGDLEPAVEFSERSGKRVYRLRIYRLRETA